MANLSQDRLTGGRLAVGALAGGLVAAIVGLGLARIAPGWAPLAPDDARYLFVGLSVLDGQGAVTPSGGAYLLRSPVYGIAMALGSRIVGGDPLVGGHLVVVVLSLLGLLGAVRIAWLAAGPGGAVGTAIALVATPLVWQLLPSLRIDLPQTALVVAILLLAWRPTTRRWAAAGVVLGVVVLVKETVLPLLLQPVALIGFVPGATVRRLAAVYVAAAVMTAAWWWVVVWTSIGQVFPMNALAVVEARDVSAALRLPWTAVPLIAVFAVSWGVVALRARHELGPRLLLGAAIALAPAAAYAAAQSLNARNFAGLAVLSAVAVGIAGATLVAAARLRLERRVGTSPSARAVSAIAMAVVFVIAVAGPVVGQRAVRRAAPDRLTDALVAWIDDNVGEGGRIVMPFREREEIALRRFGRTEVRLLGARRVDPAEPPDSFIWMGLRDRQLFGYPRTGWVTALTDPPALYLVLVGPHPFTPTDLVDARGELALPGLTLAATLDEGADHADILAIGPAGVRDGTAAVPLHLTEAAALAWLDLRAGQDAVERLVEARPVITEGDVATLLARLGGAACSMPSVNGRVSIAPAGTCTGQ